ncbi:MAG TPA: transglycosylase domain-containing protein [Methylomirabilota bacterium]|jgi:membrane peptidoglycan carboxypeptidase|nr:transglycosylase domain-containing protein [Methylomirabilota bacterium]
MDPVLARPIPAEQIEVRERSLAERWARLRARLFGVAVVAGLLLVLALIALFELRASNLQALVFSRADRAIRFAVEPGAAGFTLSVPDGGPYNARLGYSQLSGQLERLGAAGYAIDAQARPSPGLRRLAAWGLFPPYREKDQSGLRVTDRAGRPLYDVHFPERVYERFEAIPAPVVRALLFIENRELLDPQRPHLNPAVEWYRLAKAVGVETLGRLGREGQPIGASTLATQIEKFRHSPEGRTRSPGEKLRQMLSASLRAYQDGADTLPARRRIVTDYLNSLPLAAAVGRGEVLGLGDGLKTWYGTDFAEANRLLVDASRPADPARAQAYKQMLSLILAARRPYYYLTENRPALEEFTNSYLRVMARAGVIEPGLRDLSLEHALRFVTVSPPPAVDWSERKGANLVRARLTTLLGVPALYDLDRLDLAAQSTLDAPTQEAVSRVLTALREPAAVQALGLKGFHLLDRGDPARVIYSFTLYERGRHANLVRVQTDNLEQPLDINGGARIDLGSTAKLRTLISYLEVIGALHARYGQLGASELRAVEPHRKDRLTAWATDYLAKTPGATLVAMLEAAMDRRYSASPAEPFFTGGGLQYFHNFNPEDDARILSVREAFRNSVNLVFIRLLRDVVDHALYEPPASLARVLEDGDDPRRQEYLIRFADREGSEFIRRFYKKYADKTPDQALELVLGAARQTPRALATVLRSVAPDAGLDAFKAILAARLPGEPLSESAVEDIFAKHTPARFSLMDRGYLARIHPLELWLAEYLRRHPGADLGQVLKQSGAERQAVYRWLFKTERRHAQDTRIRSLLEVQAFLEIQRGWQRLGYPFASVTPSLASAIGSSGDRPAALAKLMGIVVNEGMSYRTALVERLDFAVDTPYETRLSRAEVAGERVLAPELAAVVRKALVDVVAAGTARGLRPVLERGEGDRHVVGGKTGTGDHRYETFAPGGRLIESRVVDRAATFVFLIDDRFFGTVTAYVAGRQAAHYEFTSALPVRLLGILMPALSSLISGDPARASAAQAITASPSR